MVKIMLIQILYGGMKDRLIHIIVTAKGVDGHKASILERLAMIYLLLPSTAITYWTVP